MAAHTYAPQEYTRGRLAYSALQQERLAADCLDYLPAVLANCPKAVQKDAVAASVKDADTIKGLFPATYGIPLVEFAVAETPQAPESRKPIKVAVVLSGGQAPGGHNVIAGIYDGAKRWNPDSTMIGFLDGPHGIFTGTYVEITDAIIDGYRNTGGFDMLGSGRHKIESEEQFQNSMAVCKGIGLDGLVVIGGDDSNTNGALLAEYFKANGCKTKVIGAPKTIDGDLKCPPHIPISFGFDSACKTYATLVGNVAVDALSAQKYYHLVRLMGRSATNIALEVALLTHPNACLIGEEVARDEKSLKAITEDLANMIEERSKIGKNYGVIILPEGLIEFIPEFNRLIAEINDKLSEPGAGSTEAAVVAVLSAENAAVFKYLPDFIRAQLLLDRDPHGNVQVAKIETEKLLAATIKAELEARRSKGTYAGTFSAQFHSYGYEGRAGLPTIFDSAYCYALGSTCAALLAENLTGVIASVKNLARPVKEWQCGGVPITSLCVVERRKGKNKPVIKKALVEMDGPMSQPFKAWTDMRGSLRLMDSYRIPGPIQFDMKDCEMSKDIPLTLMLELGEPVKKIATVPNPVAMGNYLYLPQTLDSRSELQQWRAKRPHRQLRALGNMNCKKIKVSNGEHTMCSSKTASVVNKHFSSIVEPLVEVDLAQNSEANLGSQMKPQIIGVVFSGRQAPGCHDLLLGMADMLKNSPGSKVLGFVGGTKGLFGKQAVELTPELCAAYSGTGGLELIGRTVDRLKSDKEMELAREACQHFGLTGLVLVGGARTHTDAAYLTEHLKKTKCQTAVVGVPCGIEGNMVNEFVEASLGFDSASKAMAQLVGNTAVDGSSARKYYYFMRMMDGSDRTGGDLPSSHVALEVALQTKPNMLLLTEEVDQNRTSLREVVNSVADLVAQRAADGKNFGLVLVAQGLLAAIPEFRSLLIELEGLPLTQNHEEVLQELTSWSRALFKSLPEFMQEQLLLERQSDGGLQISQLETERLLSAFVEDELKQRTKLGTFKGSFSSVCQFVGYQSRTSIPSNFDSDYAYALGGTAVALSAGGHNGYMATVSDLAAAAEDWRAGGVPFTAMLKIPAPGTGQSRPFIPSQRIGLNEAAFASWAELKAKCAISELFESPGPIQLAGPTANAITCTVASKFSYMREHKRLQKLIQEVTGKCRAGCDYRQIRVAAKSLDTLNEILNDMTN